MSDRDWNSIPKQTIVGFGENGGLNGDCWRCCVAAMIGRPASELPHFVQIAHDEKENPDWLTAKWLWENGRYRILEFNADIYWYTESAFRDTRLALPYIASGPTIRSKHSGHWHAVVMRDHEVLYDPHPDNAGLLHVGRKTLIVRDLYE